MSRSNAELYLLPSPLADTDPEEILPKGTLDRVADIRHFICETPRTARRFLKKLPLDARLEQLSFYPLDKGTDPDELPSYLEPCLRGERTALLSDAGCPGVADPGGGIVELAHRKEIPVVPLTGPSSFILALMASGLNGQSFRFHGYAPYDKGAMKELMGRMKKDAMGGETQLIMETPYRNDRLLDAFLKESPQELRLCIAMELTAPEGFVKTLPLGAWKKERPHLHKRPAIFLLGQ